ncbi:phage terminase protein [Candidatus Termititenax aidoneus]|uniref:Phage terminase protein n=1 Tax=Termititenax aidoneus TaxID=2218524 RepID=A0A388TDR4_TERA1|nr:phage terminase protein [Candidatus Termititenax aidoneus]
MLKRSEKNTINIVTYNELCRRSYLDYLQRVWYGAYNPAGFHELICKHLEAVERGKIKRLIINLPPQFGKSWTISDKFPSWYLARHPDRRVIAVSYGDDLAYRFGKNNRVAVEEFGYIFGAYLSKEKAQMQNWETTCGGGMIATGIGGAITGHGAYMLLVDDPIKNRQEADSPTYRARIWNEYRNTLLTRLHPDGAIIIVMTRWHEHDLCGLLLESEQDNWTVLSLPCLAEDNDLLGRERGAPLWPEYGYTADWAAKRKKSIGSVAWAGLYQQRPAPQEGSIIRRSWIKTYKQLPAKIDKWLLSWDMTFDGGEASDYVVGQVWAKSGSEYYLVDQIREKLSYTESKKAFKTLAAKYPQARSKLVEKKANGAAIIDDLKKDISGIIPVTPTESKVSRTNAVSPLFEAGNVYVPEAAPWVYDYIEELITFPNAAHDDQVDATTQALNYLDKKSKELFFSF